MHLLPALSDAVKLPVPSSEIHLPKIETVSPPMTEVHTLPSLDVDLGKRSSPISGLAAETVHTSGKRPTSPSYSDEVEAKKSKVEVASHGSRPASPVKLNTDTAMLSAAGSRSASPGKNSPSKSKSASPVREAVSKSASPTREKSPAKSPVPHDK